MADPVGGASQADIDAYIEKVAGVALGMQMMDIVGEIKKEMDKEEE